MKVSEENLLKVKGLEKSCIVYIKFPEAVL